MDAPTTPDEKAPSIEWPWMETVFVLVLFGLMYAAATALWFFMSGVFPLTDTPTPKMRLTEVACMNMLMLVLASVHAARAKAKDFTTAALARHTALLTTAGAEAALAAVSGSLIATIAAHGFIFFAIAFVIARRDLRRNALIIALFSILYILAISASLSHFAQ